MTPKNYLKEKTKRRILMPEVYNKHNLVPVIMDFEEYLKNKNLASSSIYVYVSAAKKFLLTNPDLEKIDSYNDFIFEHAIKKRSNYTYDSLKLFIKYYFEKDPRSISLQRSLLKPKPVDPKKSVHYLDDDTREGVIKMLLNYKHRVIARIQNATGVRAGDILRLKRGSISYESYLDKAVVMRIDFEGKGGKHFVKWVFDEAIQTQIDLFIKGNILDSEYYFLERPGNQDFRMVYHMNYRRYWKDLKLALKTYGVDYKEWATHDFRRSFARNVWDQTHDPVIMKDMLNHAQFDTTLRYLRGSGLQSKDIYYELNEKKKEDG